MPRAPLGQFVDGSYPGPFYANHAVPASGTEWAKLCTCRMNIITYLII